MVPKQSAASERFFGYNYTRPRAGAAAVYTLYTRRAAPSLRLDLYLFRAPPTLGWIPANAAFSSASWFFFSCASRSSSLFRSSSRLS